MDKKKKLGVILTLTGLCTLFISLVLSTGYYPQLGILGSISGMQTVFKEGEWYPYPSIKGEKIQVDLEDGRIVNVPAGLSAAQMLDYIEKIYQPSFIGKITGSHQTSGYYKGRVAMPFKYAFSIGIILIFSGVGLIIISKGEQD